MIKTLKIVLLVFWMLVIFTFSQTNGEKSSGKSIGILKKTVITISDAMYNIKIIKKPISDKKASEIANKLNYPARKLMHISEYFILALLFYLVYASYNIKKVYILTVTSSILYAISDEVHQLFTGRTGKVTDVLVDTIGIMVAILVIYSVKKRKTKVS